MWSGMNRADRSMAGLTLMEILVALILTGIVLLAIGQLESFRRGTQQTQESMDLLQTQTQQAMYHMEKRFYGAYFIRFDPAVPSDIHLQMLQPGALGEPPNPDLLDNTNSFHYVRYHWDAPTQRFLYEENVRDDGSPLPPGLKQMVLATHVQSVVFTPVEPNIYTVMIQVHDPHTNRDYALGPMRLSSREMVAVPPPGWEPPMP